MSRLIKGLVIFLILVGALLVGLVLAAETTWFSHFVARQASARFDRQVTIGGPFEIDWSLHPRVRVPSLTIANVPWAGEKPLAEIATTDLLLDLTGLLRGRLAVDDLSLSQPRLTLVRAENGRSNWQELTEKRGPGGPSAVTLDKVRVRDGHIDFQDATQTLALNLAVQTTPTETGAERLHLVGTGTRRGRPFEFDLRGGPLLAVTDPSRPYPVAGTLQAGKTMLKGEGTLLRPAAPASGTFEVVLQGPNPAELHDLLGLTLPDLPPYQLQGHLTFEKDIWRFQKFSGTVGDSDLAGDLVIRPGKPLILETELTSRRLDLDDLLPALGAAPATGKGETASAEQKQKARTEKQDKDALPKARPDRSRLEGVEAWVRFRGERVNAPRKIPLERVSFTLNLKDGVLRFEPLTFGVGGGKINSQLTLDVRKQPVQGKVEARMQDVDLGNLLTDFGVPGGGFGTIRAKLDTRFAGESVKQAFASTDGSLLLYMTSGQVNAVLVSLAGLDAGQALIERFFGSGETKIECAFTHVKANDGLAK
ncbi:MAG TPA: AsmA family protein, partial [Gammaproteobacteria bacterium]|nr:AsmA family protein [Gammaproteobacteria bacterium]